MAKPTSVTEAIFEFINNLSPLKKALCFIGVVLCVSSFAIWQSLPASTKEKYLTSTLEVEEQGMIVSEQFDHFKVEAVVYNPNSVALMVNNISLIREFSKGKGKGKPMGIVTQLPPDVDPPPPFLIKKSYKINSKVKLTHVGETGWNGVGVVSKEKTEYHLKLSTGINQVSISFEAILFLPPKKFTSLTLEVPKSIVIETLTLTSCDPNMLIPNAEDMISVGECKKFIEKEYEQRTINFNSTHSEEVDVSFILEFTSKDSKFHLNREYIQLANSHILLPK